MPDSKTTTTQSLSKSDLEAENDRLRGLLENAGINPDEALDPDRGIVGNLADVQRFFGAVAKGEAPDPADAVVPFKPERQDPVDLQASDTKPDTAK